jgi:hypothetical protein
VIACTRCAAPLPARGALCTYCGAVDANPDASGEVVTASLDAQLHPGWRRLGQVEFEPGPRSGELVARTGALKGGWYTALRTHGIYDDVDLSATFRFLEGRRDDDPVRAAFSVRLRDGACYVPCLTATGSFSLGAIVPDGDKKRWDKLVPRGPSDSIDTRPGAENRLRVVVIDQRLQVWINGLLHASVRDDRLTQGYAEVMVNPAGAPCRVAWSHLVLAVPG